MQNNTLPKHWQLKKLGEICSRIVDGSHNPPKPRETGYPMLSAKDINYNTINFSTPRLIELNDFESENKRTQIEVGDVLLTIVATIGRTAVVPKNAPKFTLQRSVAVIKSNQNPYYLSYFFQSSNFQKQLQDNAKGTAQKGVYLKTLNSLNIIVPPLPEQHLIVSKIEELFSELDKGIESLQTALAQLKTYRQAVLKWAFEGKLTNPNVKEGELPKGWKVEKLRSVLDFIGSGITPKGGQSVYQSEGVMLIRSQNVYPNILILDDVAFISKEIDEKMKRSRIQSFDVLLNITGASIGRCTYVPSNFPPANVNQHVCIIRISQDIVNCKFLAMYLNSTIAQQHIMNTQSGATRQGLNYEQIREIEFPLCDPSNQLKVVQEIESRLSVADKMEETISQSLQQAEVLKQSILKQAFEGRLV